ncbi:hypothetical protein DYB32_005063 [Aphanomyces invadans]|uniref:Cation/H+ exchanger transmembrane domain-containing protein n=1 Tax=Aphanomyces invadans TaxID=157072 RepID=A0A418AVN9_9STRA|nr:hypothetical protein DYB32_005063 [Aphanomyces invadans]
MVPSELNALKAHEEQTWTGLELLVCAVLQLILVFLAYRLDRSTAQQWFIPESACAIFFGLCVRGALIWLGHLGWITSLTPAEAYLYGSLISAVDPVATLSVFKKSDAPPMLFNLVFGESVLNDGVGTSMAATPLSLSSRSFFSLLTSGLSGIVALFFSGVLMSHYHLTTISQESATALKHLLSTLAFLAENFIFLYLGVSVVAYSGAFKWDWAFIGWQLVILVVARAANTFPLCGLANVGRKEQIPLSVFGMLTGPLLTTLGLAKTSMILSLRPEAVKLLDETDTEETDDDDASTMRRRHGGDMSTNGGGMQGLWTSVDEKYLMPFFGHRSDPTDKAPREGSQRGSKGRM